MGERLLDEEMTTGSRSRERLLHVQNRRRTDKNNCWLECSKRFSKIRKALCPGLFLHLRFTCRVTMRICTGKILHTQCMKIFKMPPPYGAGTAHQNSIFLIHHTVSRKNESNVLL